MGLKAITKEFADRVLSSMSSPDNPTLFVSITGKQKKISGIEISLPLLSDSHLKNTPKKIKNDSNISPTKSKTLLL